MIRVALPFGKTPDGKRNPYRRALNAVDVQPVKSAATLAGLDGLLLAGGPDVDPALFGAPRDPKTGDPDRERDNLETALLREALDRDLPVLAICRGLQLLNVHPIAITGGSKLRSILEVDEFAVNSRHHPCVDRVATTSDQFPRGS